MPLDLQRRRETSPASWKYLWAAVGGSALTGVLIVWRHFYWQHALLVGLAGGALVYSALRTYENLRRMH